MKKIILILLMGILMNPTFHLYGMKITLAGDLTVAKDRAHLARLLMFKTKLVNVNNLDIIQNNLRLNDGTHVHVMSQHGFDSATIYVPPPKFVPEPKEDTKQEVLYLPYMFAPEYSFPYGGVLVCHGGYSFNGAYELLSPYGDDSYSSSYRYQPYSYENDDGETVVLEWQIKEYYDPITGIWWDEAPWMSDGDSWDPVYCESYETSLVDKPNKIEISTTTTKPPFEGMFASSWPDFMIGNTTRSIGDVVSGTYNGVLAATEPRIIVKSTRNGYPSTSFRYAIDQLDPSKYGILYRTSGGYVLSANNENVSCNVFNDNKLYFSGLGHNVDLTQHGVNLPDWINTTSAAAAEVYGWPYSSGYRTDTDIRIRLYLIGGKYVCLFSIYCTQTHPAYGSNPGYSQKFFGSAVEGGDFNILEVTSGVDFMGEARNMMPSGGITTTFGILLRRGPEQKINSNGVVVQKEPYLTPIRE